jgi:3-oxoacyl-[acyl-carrier protein] reductase
MPIDISNRVAFVTGASRGLGRAIAIELGRAGCDVAVGYLKNKAAAEVVASAIQQLGRRATAVQIDVSSVSSVTQAKDCISQRLGPPSILINNAGDIPRPGTWNELVGEDLDRTLGVNLKGPILCIQSFAPSMIEARFGRIVNISSTYAITGAAAVMAYTAAKAGVIAVTSSLAREFGKHGITVNAVAPGNFLTDMAEDAGEGFKQWVRDTAPLGRLGDPEELAEATVFLVRHPYITGHNLVVDGGHILNM